MKKLTVLLLIMATMVLLTACGNEKTSSKSVIETVKSSIQGKNSSKNKTAENKPNNASGNIEEKIEAKESSGEENFVLLENNTKVEEEPSKNENSEYTIIKFSDMYETKGTIKNVSTVLKNLNGKKVQMKGYPAVQSPLDESFVYLNNQPYVTCPFCTIGDTTKLEVIPIYMANGSKIKFTENALNIYGKLEVAEKVDSEGYTTQFRIYADKVEEIQDSGANKEVNDYYLLLSQKGMIYDIQTLQMNVEYASNPEFMKYYDEKVQTGASKTIDQVAVAKALSEEYLSYDSEYGDGFGSGYTYLDYVKECPDIVKTCEPKDERLKGLNDELIELYNKEIKILEKYQDVCYKIYALKDNLTSTQAADFLKELHALNSDNLKQYNEFTAWNNKLRD